MNLENIRNILMDARADLKEIDEAHDWACEEYKRLTLVCKEARIKSTDFMVTDVQRKKAKAERLDLHDKIDMVEYAQRALKEFRAKCLMRVQAEKRAEAAKPIAKARDALAGEIQTKWDKAATILHDLAERAGAMQQAIDTHNLTYGGKLPNLDAALGRQKSVQLGQMTYHPTPMFSARVRLEGVPFVDPETDARRQMGTL